MCENDWSKSTIFDKMVGTKLRHFSNYSPLNWYNVEAPNFVSRTLGPPTMRQGAGRDHALCKTSALQTRKGKIHCIKSNKIATLQRSDFQILLELILSKIVNML